VGGSYLHDTARGVSFDVVDGTAHGSRRFDARHDAAGGRRDAPASSECAPRLSRLSPATGFDRTAHLAIDRGTIAHNRDRTVID